MYDIVKEIISHTWVDSTRDQGYIYYICGALIIITTAVFIDMVYKIIYSVTHKGNL